MCLIKRLSTAVLGGSSLLIVLAQPLAAPPMEDRPVFTGAAGTPAIVVKSPYNLEQTVDHIKAAAEGNNFRVIREQSINFGLVEEEFEDQHTRILYFCNFDMLYSALQADERVGVFLPCQVNIVERQDGVYVIAPDPKAINAAFLGNSELGPACDHLSKAYQAIVEEGTM